MAFTDIPLRRSIPVGIAAYAIQYGLMLLVVLGRIGLFTQTTTLEYESIGPRTLADVLEATPPLWKFAGWILHNAHYSDLVVPVANYLGVPRVNLISKQGGLFTILFVLPPIVLVGAGYLAATTGPTSGYRGEDLAGTSIIFGYLLCCIAGGLLFTFQRPTVGPALASTLFIAGGVYPLVFGFLGGRLARFVAD